MDQFQKKKLGIFWPSSVVEKEGKYFTDSYQHYQFSALSDYFNIDLIAPVFNQPENRGQKNERIDTEKLNIEPLPSATGWFNFYIRRFPKIIAAMWGLFQKKQGEWDLLLLIEPCLYSQMAYWIARRFKIPTVLFEGGSYDYWVLYKDKSTRMKNWFWKLLSGVWALGMFVSERVLTRLVPCVVTGQELYEHHTRYNKKVLLYYSSLIKEEDIRPSVREPSSGCLQLLCITRLVPIKGIEYLIEAIQKTSLSFEVKLKIVGSGDRNYEDQIRKKISENHLEEKIKLCGSMIHGPELMKLFENADLFVLPSLSEGTPKVLFEAMAKGLPILATKVGGIPSMVNNDRFALLVEPANSGALAEGIISFARSPALRKELGGKGLEAVRNYTLTKQAKRLADFLYTCARR